MPDRLRIATWNLWWRFGDCAERAPLILDHLRETDVDVIGLQEVWFDDDENQAEAIAHALGFDHRFAPSPAPEKWQRRIDDSKFGIGNAVLSRWPIESSTAARLPTGNAPDEGRVALHTAIATPRGSLSFTTTHLNSAGDHSTIRAEQLAEATRFVARHAAADFPAVLCGDFNAGPDEPEVDAVIGHRAGVAGGLPLRDGWSIARPDATGDTWDDANPHVHARGEGSHRIDYLLLGPTSSGAGTKGDPIDGGLIGTEATDGVWPSDHFGVWLDVSV